MHLKQLIIQGFKSFADRTTFTFDRSGMTVIVGPNGCGKSNVFEAVKWVLGEQRPTSLRSRELTDVIFNGTVRRPPMGLCEGTLVFDNTSGTLPTSEAEVTVLRRVYRSGDSDYQINGRSCRLKDVRDMFAGTGLGAGGYGFMEQGKIDSILASNPLERRKVFEEAAGISRFRARRRETELKLNRVEDNLTRLHDIVEEIERQIRSLKIHAGKARSHRELTGRVRELQLTYSVHRYRSLSDEQGKLAATLKERESDRDSTTGVHLEAKEELKAIEAELHGLLEGIGGVRARYAEVQERMKSNQERIAFQGRYAGELDQRRSSMDDEIRSLRLRLESLESELTTVSEDQDAIESDQDRLSRDLNTQKELALKADQVVGEAERGRSEAEKYLRDLERRESELSREQARMEAQRHHAEEALQTIGQKREQLSLAGDESRGRFEQQVFTQKGCHSGLQDRRQALEELAGNLEAMDQRVADAHGSLREQEQDLGRLQARRDALDGLLTKREGLDSGVRALLEEHERDPGFMPGLRGVLHELIEVDLPQASTVQAALGDYAGALVVESSTDVAQALDWLAANKAGRAVLLPLDRFPPGSFPDGHPIKACADGIEGLIDALLSGVEVVSESRFREVLNSHASCPPLVVSLGGASLRDGRVVESGGDSNDSQGWILLQAELQDLGRRLPAVEEAEAQARSRMQDLRVERDELRKSQQVLTAELVEEERESARLDQVVVRLASELDRIQEEVHQLVGREEETRARESQLIQELAQISESREAGQADRQKAEGRLGELDRQVAAAREQKEKAADALGQVKIEAAQASERRSALQAKYQQLQEAVKDVAARLESNERDILDLDRARTQALEQVKQAEESMVGLKAESSELANTLKERESAADLVRERVQQTAEKLAGLEQRLEEIRESLSIARGREGELRAAVEGLMERAREDLDMDLTTAVADAPEPEEEVDLKAMEGQIKGMKEKIIRLGNVNLAAVEELEEAEERATFILRERDDLIDSREQLKQVLKAIEEESTGLFVRTFEAVSEHFSSIFRRLFGGGKAEIFLENPETPLESGIEIKARPPGKEFRSITLLSGGERTMTAVALLFAIFRANPAPCAFLDEVDAALDEDNTDRFCRMLMEFNDRSQFVVVSHSKRTMERADILYGVTMPERGVSRRVAVRLEQMDEQGRFRNLASVNRSAAAASQESSEDQSGEEEVNAPQTSALEVPATARRARGKQPDHSAQSGSEEGAG